MLLDGSREWAEPEYGVSWEGGVSMRGRNSIFVDGRLDAQRAQAPQLPEYPGYEKLGPE